MRDYIRRRLRRSIVNVKEVYERREREGRTYDFHRVEKSGLFDVKRRGRGENSKVF